MRPRPGVDAAILARSDASLRKKTDRIIEYWKRHCILRNNDYLNNRDTKWRRWIFP
jgi:hypothetical protein